jgi:hypothetical protein
MPPSHFRPVSHIELVSGQSDIGSFEHEIARGKLGTTWGREIHINDTLEWNHKRMWLAVVARTMKDAVDEDMGDFAFLDTPEMAEAERNVDEAAERLAATVDALAWPGSDDFDLVMEFVGLGPVADRIAEMDTNELVANLAEFEKREERERKERGRK